MGIAAVVERTSVSHIPAILGDHIYYPKVKKNKKEAALAPLISFSRRKAKEYPYPSVVVPKTRAIFFHWHIHGLAILLRSMYTI